MHRFARTHALAPARRGGGALGRLVAPLALAAMLLMPRTGLALESYVAELQTLYPNLSESADPGTLRCTRCHLSNLGGGPRNPFGNAMFSAAGATSSARIRNAAEAGYVPRATGFSGGGVTVRVPAGVSSAIGVNYNAGLSNQTGGGASLAGFAFADATPGLPFGFTAGGDLQRSGAATPGTVYSFRVVPTNSANFRPLDAANRPVLSIRINRPPDAGAPVTGPNVNAGSGTVSSVNLVALAADADADALTLLPGPTITSVIDQDGNAVAPVPGISAQASPGGILSFNSNAFNALTTAETRTITFAYTVSDGLETDAGSYSVTVAGTAPVPNSLPVVSPRTLEISEDASLPVSTDLTRNDAGTPFPDADGDPLAVANLVEGAATRPDLTLGFSLAGNAFRVTGLGGGFQALKAGEEARFAFRYDVSDGTGFQPNDLTVTVTGANDRVVARDGFVASAIESPTPVRFNLRELSEASDPDGDPLVFTGLTGVASTPALASPASARIVEGEFFEVVPQFARLLAEGEVVALTFRFTISDGQGGDKVVEGRVNVTGAAGSSHGTRAGLYADSLSERYPLAQFQRVGNLPTGSNREGACFTCHTVEANLDGAKPDCNNTVNFTSYGRALCNAGRGTAIGPRLAAVEAQFAPSVIEASIRRMLDEGAAAGTAAGAPIQVNPGRMVDGRTSRIKSFDVRDPNGAPSRLFTVDAAGQVRALAPPPSGTHVIHVMPFNISGSRDRNEQIRDVRGFYPLNAGRTRITIEVRAAIPLPVADAANTQAGDAVRIDVLANDGGGRADSVAIVGAAANGAASVESDRRTVLYVPRPGFVGVDRFTYAATGPAGTSDPAEVTVTVIPRGGALARDDTASTTLNQPVEVDVLANDLGTPRPTVRIVAQPAEGSARVTGDQRIRYTPSAGFTGTVVVLYEARNALAATRAELSITVEAFSADIFADATRDPQLRRVARALGETCAAIGSAGAASGNASDLLGICGDLAADVRAGAGIDPALAAIRNEEALAVFDTVDLIARQTGTVLRGRIDQIRQGNRGGIVDASGLSLSMGEASLSGQQVEDSLREMLAGGGDAPVTGSRWSLFAAGEVSFGDLDATSSRADDLSLQAINLTVGADYRFDAGLFGGLAVSFARAETDFSGGGGIDADSFEVSAYGLYEGFAAPGLSVSGFASYGVDSFDQTRRIAFTTNGEEIDRRARADYSGTHLNLGAELNYELPLDYTIASAGVTGTLNVFLGADYLVSWIDAYDESGAGGLNLWVDEETYESLLLSVGVEAYQSAPALCACHPYQRLTLSSEMLDDSRSLTSRFRVAGSDGPTFEVTEDGGETLFATVEIGTVIDIRTGALDLSFATSVDADGFFGYQFGATGAMPLFGNDALELGLGASREASDLGLAASLDYRLRF